MALSAIVIGAMITELRDAGGNGGSSVRTGPFGEPRDMKSITATPARAATQSAIEGSTITPRRVGCPMVPRSYSVNRRLCCNFLSRVWGCGALRRANKRIAASASSIWSAPSVSLGLDSAGKVPERAFNHDGDLRTGSRPALRKIDSRTDANLESRGPIQGRTLQG